MRLSPVARLVAVLGSILGGPEASSGSFDRGLDALAPDAPAVYSCRQMAAARAIEAEREDRLFDDWISKHLAGAALMEDIKARIAAKPTPTFSRKIAVRTRYFDEVIRDWAASCEDEGDTQLLLLAAGMDTRAWRLPELGRSTTVVEADLPQVIHAKQRVLDEIRPALRAKARACAAVDLRHRRWMERLARDVAGFDAGKPTCVVVEGLTMYLPERLNRRLLRTLGARLTHEKSVVALSLVDRISLEDAQNNERSRLLRSWRWGIDEDEVRDTFRAWLGPGWEVRAVDAMGSPAANFGVWRDGDRTGMKRRGLTLYVVCERVG